MTCSEIGTPHFRAASSPKVLLRSSHFLNAARLPARNRAGGVAHRKRKLKMLAKLV